MLQNALGQQNEYDDFDVFMNVQIGQLLEALIDKQQENVAGYFASAQCDPSADMCCGVSTDNIGYLSIDRMHCYEATGTEPDTISDLNVLSAALDSAYLTLSEIEALIIDIRLN